MDSVFYHDYDINDNQNQYDDLVTVTDDMNVDFMKISQGDDMVIQYNDTDATKSTKKKRSTKSADPSKVVKVDNKKSNGLEPYSDKYKETNDLLRGVVYQIDSSLADITQDIAYIRASKSMRSKYTYLSNLQDTASSLVGNKIAAIREINNSISKAEDFELKRAKELKLNENVDDDKYIHDMYKAFVTASVPNAYSQLGPSTYDMTMNPTSFNMVNISPETEQEAYENYINNMTPQQHMIALENDPNVKQVVLWNKSTGAKSFEIMNMATGEILNNVDKRDIMFMEDTYIDERNRIARNTKLNEVYPLVTIGESVIDEY